MGNESTATASKSDKTSPPPKEQPPIYPYPDWSALQAYYGPGMIPPPYYSAPGHAPQPYMWAPQPIMPPYSPFMYPHGGAYSHHPAMPFVPQHMSTESPAKSATEKESKSAMRKHKEVNCFALSSAANGVTEKASSEESDDRKNVTGVTVVQKRKQSSADEPMSDTKSNKKSSSWKDGEASGPSKVTSEIGEITVKPLPDLPAYPTASAVSNSTIPSSRNTVTDLWYKDEKEMKREKRKQSNRESARRSRLRKQAETEELTVKVESLTAENNTLKSEIGRLTQGSEKLKSENSVLQEKLKKQAGQVMPSSVVVENFLSMIDKNANTSANIEAQDNTNNNTTNGKLHQLLDPARRTDAVAAS
ncbi:common plant regulatory factor 1-like protein [Carex littledalei]|uniref:Common plant regulatory factor 1-like protein n=1 Tax=Carex littledalei TaxID=544730 RepID=A0A833VSE2_9POAL|nr:common plant regulatory factor 1-like protein [Carex littledalei]